MSVRYADLPAQNRPLRAELVAALERVLDHGMYIGGPEVGELECALSGWLGVADVVSCNSGTDALVLALVSAGVGPGDEVITVSHSFIATANAIRLVGATPVFVDIDDETMVMDTRLVEAAISERTRAVVPVHLNGWPCELSELAELCEARNLALIEDCAQSIGSSRDNRRTGTHGVGAFSLHPLKALAAVGDAGFVSAPSRELGATLRQLRNHGLVDRDHCRVVGYNTRMDTLQAAFVLAKLPALPSWLEARRAHAAAYRAELSDIVRMPPDDPAVEQTYSAFVVRHPQRDRLRGLLLDRGIDVKVHYPVAMHAQAAHADLEARPLPVTERVVGEILSLPVAPEVSVAEREQVIEAVREVAKQL